MLVSSKQYRLKNGRASFKIWQYKPRNSLEKRSSTSLNFSSKNKVINNNFITAIQKKALTTAHKVVKQTK